MSLEVGQLPVTKSGFRGRFSYWKFLKNTAHIVSEASYNETKHELQLSSSLRTVQGHSRSRGLGYS